MFKKLFRFIICVTVFPVAVVAWPKTKTSKDLTTQVSSPVTYVRERTFVDLANFGLEARAYTFMLGDKRIVVGVDYIRNLSGINEELPSDLSDYVINAIGKISPQFGTYRKFSGSVAIPGALLAAPAPADSTKVPGVDFWISGSLERASEITKYESKKGVDGTGGGGHGQFDAHAGRNRAQTIKSLTVTFTLEGPDKLSIPGASATYRIDVGQLQRGHSFSVYVAGSGISLDSTVTISQNLDDAIYDATAASIIHLIGNALLVPYYRCGPLFEPDPDLDNRVHDALARLTRAEIEQDIKNFMIVEGYPMDLSSLSLTDHDRAVLELEMRHRSIIPSGDQRLMVEFAFSLWKNLDYINGAKRIQARLAEIARIRGEQEEAARRAAADAAAKQQEQTRREHEAAARKAAALAAARHQQQAKRKQREAECRTAAEALASQQQQARQASNQVPCQVVCQFAPRPQRPTEPAKGSTHPNSAGTLRKAFLDRRAVERNGRTTTALQIRRRTSTRFANLGPSVRSFERQHSACKDTPQRKHDRGCSAP